MGRYISDLPVATDHTSVIVYGSQSSTAKQVPVSVLLENVVRDFTFVLGRGIDVEADTGVTNPLIASTGMTITKAYIAATTGPVGSDLIVDINLNGTSIWDSTQANRLKIVDGNTSGSQTSFDTTSISEGDILTIDIDQIGSTTPGQDVVVVLKARRA